MDRAFPLNGSSVPSRWVIRPYTLLCHDGCKHGYAEGMEQKSFWFCDVSGAKETENDEAGIEPFEKEIFMSLTESG